MKDEGPDRTGYRLPPEPIPSIIDAPPTPSLTLSPDRQWLAWLERRGLPPLAELAEPELRLAGARINPRTNARSRMPHLAALSFGRLDAEPPLPVAVPEEAKITYPRWSPDSRRLAFVHTGDSGAEVWVAEVSTGESRRLVTPPLNAAFGVPFRWLPDGSGLLVRCIAESRGAPPPAPLVASGPVIRETSGRPAPRRTHQDLLDGPHSELLFEYYFTAQLWRVPLQGTLRPIGEPGLIATFDPAPRGDLVLTERVERPFSYLVPYHRFGSRVDLIDLDGRVVSEIARLPLAETVPAIFDAVPTGPRGFHWRADAPAELVWVEAADEGDPRIKSSIRDRVFSRPTPDAEPRQLLELEHRYAGIYWGRGDFALALSRWWLTRTERRIAFRPDGPDTAPRVLVERSYQDLYGDPGYPLTQRNEAGRAVLQFTGDGSGIFLAGAGASPDGAFPFLDRMEVIDGATSRLWRSPDDAFEQVAAVLDADGDRLLVRRESSTEPPNYHILHHPSGAVNPVTRFPDPAPQLAGIRRRIITYHRADGLELSATLITPPGYDADRDGPLPLLMWAYPREFRDAGDAAQVDDSPHRFSRPTGASHLFLLTQGFAVLDGPSMPVIGEGAEEPNDTYIEQMVASAEAAVEAVVALGVADRNRIAIGGHSYGAFMTGTLLAHTELFRAGIARSGAYNRTLTPFGFQQEQRSYWEAPEVYHRMSPFSHAHQITAPILLLHGAEDNNSGTFPLQSDRLYHALEGLGATARYVLLPHEGHGYRARESVLHVLAEMVEWLQEKLA